MPRFFLEVSYKGTNYSGFQIQRNAVTIQSEVEKALSIFFKQPFHLTGSSRTDAGVHALQNFFHFDWDEDIHPSPTKKAMEGAVYNLNAILPPDIVIRSILPVSNDTHCRFDAVSREYKYFVYQRKDPFLADRAFYFPYHLNLDRLNKAAALVQKQHDFISFSKRNTQVKNFLCDIIDSRWLLEENTLVYQVKANRFLRGMVKGLVGTMLRAGTQKITINQFEKIFLSKDCSLADFSVPSHGLFLIAVNYRGDIRK